MATETGNQLQLAYIAETTFNTTPATPTGQILRWTDCSFGADRSYLENPEMRTDRMMAAGAGGVILGKGDIGGILSYGTFDDFLAYVTGNATWSTNVVKVATTRKSFTLEKGYKVNGLYYPFTGCVVDTCELNGKVNDNVGIKFGIIAAGAGTEAAATIWTGTTAANTNNLITTWQGTVKKATVSQANVVSWSLKLDNGYAEAYACGSSSLYDLQPGRLKVTGTLEVYFDSNAHYTDFRAENDVALQLNLGPGGTKSYQIDLTRCRFKSMKADPSGESFVIAKIEFESVVPTSGTNTSLMITRLP